MAKLSIRGLKSFEDFERCVEIQREVWRHPDIDITPAHQFCVSVKMGAVMLGGFADGALAGFVYSFPAVAGGALHLHSHLLAVLPRYQGLGLGKKLKWAQREEAIRAGYRLITWTFDPMQTRNANLNLQALAAISRTYLPNFYGMTPSLCLAPGIPTDRLLIEWPIREDRVAKKAEGKDDKKLETWDAERLPKALERKAKPEAKDGSFAPRRPDTGRKERVLLVEIPKDIHRLKDRADLVKEWQSALRRTMTHYFAAGYHAGHFLFGERCFYVLKK